MKLILVLTTLVIAAHSLSDRKQWDEFKRTFSKRYNNLAEENARFLVFQQNLRKVEKINEKFEKGEISYSGKINGLSDLTQEEFLGRLNPQMGTTYHSNAVFFKSDPKLSVPDAMDWRKKGAVLDDGRHVASWAFSAIGALEGQLVIKKNETIHLSEQELVDCVYPDQEGRKEGNAYDAFEYVKKKGGICDDKNYPYTGQNETCHSLGRASLVLNVQGYQKVNPTEEDIKVAVGTVGPVAIGLYVNEDFQLYSKGIFNATCQGPVNHQLLAVGYGNENNEEYWIIKNSWGEEWGENGYLRMIRGRDQCSITSYPATYPVLL